MMTVFKKEWLTFLRDKHSFFTYLFMPFVLIGILGTALSGAFSSDGPDLDPVKLAVVNEDQGVLGTRLVTVLKSDRLSDVFTVVNKDPEVQLTIPEDYSERLVKQIKDNQKDANVHPPELTIETDNPSAIGVSVLKQLASQFSRTVVERGVLGNKIVDIRGMSEKIQVQPLPTHATLPSAFQYYAIGMGVMYLLFMGIGGTKALLEEINRRTLQRLSMVPRPLWKVVMGKFLGWTVLGVCQFLILMIGTHYLYGVDWGTSYAALVGLLLAYVWAVTSLGMLLAAFIHDEKSADMAGNIGVNILAAAGGSMLPIYLFPDFLDHLTAVIPNSWALHGFLEILQGGGLQAVAENIGVLLGMGLLFFAIAAWRLQARIGVNVK